MERGAAAIQRRIKELEAGADEEKAANDDPKAEEDAALAKDGDAPKEGDEPKEEAADADAKNENQDGA